MAQYTVGGVRVGGADGTLITQITNSNVDEGLATMLARGSGGIYDTFVSLGQLNPRISFTSRDIKTGLNVCGLAPVKLTAADPAEVWLQQYESGGGRVSAGSKLLTISNGLLVWRGIDAPDGAPASSTWEIIPWSSDGSTDPLSWTDSETMPTDEAGALWTVSGDALYQSWSIDTGISAQPFHGDGLPWPQDVSIERIQPVCTIDMLSINNTGSYTVASVALQDCTEGGARGANPITFTFNEKLDRVERIGGGGGALTAGVRVVCTYDGTNLPIVITGLT
ncbi:MAG: hypothetical protein PVH68_04765 [Armatimonadota bacterium]|jgi:hypothetical protein